MLGNIEITKIYIKFCDIQTETNLFLSKITQCKKNKNIQKNKKKK